MSKALPRTAAAREFARGNYPRTNAALTFSGPFAHSYDEPIAYRDGRTLYATNVGRAKGSASLTATFSTTTAQHVGAVVGAWAVENGADSVVFVDHADIRKAARAAGQTAGRWGARFDA